MYIRFIATGRIEISNFDPPLLEVNNSENTTSRRRKTDLFKIKFFVLLFLFRLSCGMTTVVWFRKGLRLHDNACLVEAAKNSKHVLPVFVLDPAYCTSARVAAPRMQFLLEALKDLDEQLVSRYGSRLVVLHGEATQTMDELFRGDKVKGLKISRCLWEEDPVEPYALKRDAAVMASGKKHKVDTQALSCAGHTLWDLKTSFEENEGKVPTTMPAMLALADRLGDVLDPLECPKNLPPLPPQCQDMSLFQVPIASSPPETVKYAAIDGLQGGESFALARLKKMLEKNDGKWVRSFEKPKTKSTDWDPPSTTVLSPYMKFGCLSARYFYKELLKTKPLSKPPGSLLGQIFFREMAYLHAYEAAVSEDFQFHVQSPEHKGIRTCIPWTDDDTLLLDAWENGMTGFPYIDACMRQLKTTGWIHHLQRHAVACFLTRGDLWVSWEKGAAHFERQLLDADYAMNNFNWLGLSGISKWSPPYFRVYNPAPDAKSALNVDDGAMIRHFIPELKDFPLKYIFTPWKAPIADQNKANCRIGKDYPKPIVDHATASKANIANFKEAASKQAEEKKNKRSILDVEDDSAAAKKKKKKPPTPPKSKKTKK